MKKNEVYILEDRGLLYINGEDAKDFLQNIITNNIEKVTNVFSKEYKPYVIGKIISGKKKIKLNESIYWK